MWSVQVHELGGGPKLIGPLGHAGGSETNSFKSQEPPFDELEKPPFNCIFSLVFALYLFEVNKGRIQQYLFLPAWCARMCKDGASSSIPVAKLPAVLWKACMLQCMLEYVGDSGRPSQQNHAKPVA